MPPGCLPDFIVIGAMKCATSTVHSQLARQPGIFMSEPKEPNFFSDDDVYAQGMDWYRSLFRPGCSGALRGESSTHYTKLPTFPRCAERLYEHLPGARLIYIMRHPIDRLVSQYIHEWSRRRINVPLDKAIDAFPELVQYSRYNMQLNPYLERYGRGRILPVFFERLISAPQEEFQRICRFVAYAGVARWEEAVPVHNVSAQRLRASPWRDALVEAPVLHTLRRLLPRSLRNRVKRLWQMQDRPELGVNARSALEKTFDRDLAQLGEWLGVSLCCRNFRQVVGARSLDWVP